MTRPLPPIDRFRNKMERAYGHRLAILKAAGEIVDWRFEEVKFNIGVKSFYLPDFWVVFEDHFEVHEVKGFKREAGIKAWRSAAKQFPWFKWVLVTQDKKTKQWEFTVAE